MPGFPDVRLVVALSGGVDSTALLAALAGLTRARGGRAGAAQARGLGASGDGRSPAGPRVRAIHVNHGIHPNAANWARHCRALARSLKVPLRVLTTRVTRQPRVSLEAAARDARYALLAEALEPGEFLLTGHHEDDQLETVLLQLFRGAGLPGLSAMPSITPFARGWLARPLLSRSRTELEAWTRDAGLSWIEDDTNADESLDRNYLRRQIMPLVRARWKGVGAAVARSARHAAEGQRLLDMLARTNMERATNGAELSVPALRALQLDQRRNVLRFWIARSGARAPDTSRLEEMAGPMIDARPDANPRVEWGGVRVERHADLLSIARVGREIRAGHVGRVGTAPASSARGAAAPATDAVRLVIDWRWKIAPRLELGQGGGTLELKADPHGPIDLDALPEIVRIGARQGGERLRPRRGGPRRSLKSLLQESHLPIVQRSRLPLLFSGETLLAVGSLWVDESIQVTPATRRRARLFHSDPSS